MISPVQSRLIDAELAPVAIATQIDAATAVKSHDAEKQIGASLVKLIDSAKIADLPQDPSRGSLLDTTA